MDIDIDIYKDIWVVMCIGDTCGCGWGCVGVGVWEPLPSSCFVLRIIHLITNGRIKIRSIRTITPEITITSGKVVDISFPEIKHNVRLNIFIFPLRRVNTRMRPSCWPIPLTPELCIRDTNMLASKNAKICITPNTNAKICVIPNPNHQLEPVEHSSHWVRQSWVCVGHVD